MKTKIAAISLLTVVILVLSILILQTTVSNIKQPRPEFIVLCVSLKIYRIRHRNYRFTVIFRCSFSCKRLTESIEWRQLGKLPSADSSSFVA